MNDADIENARKVIAAASAGPATWSYDANETEEQTIERFLLAYKGAKGITEKVGLHTVEVNRKDDGTCEVFAFTGNGPTSAANARYIVGSMDPVAGWAAALDEVVYLRNEIKTITEEIKQYHEQIAIKKEA